MGIRHVLAVALLAVGAPMVLSCAARTADGDTDPEEDVADGAQALSGIFQIRTRHSGKCLDVEWASSADGARLIQWDCHGGNNQRFQFDDLGNGFHRIRAYHSDKCLDVTGASADDGAQIIQYVCHGGTNQQFQLVRNGDGFYAIIARNSGKCFDIAGASQDLRAPVIQYRCHGGYNQQFSIN